MKLTRAQLQSELRVWEARARLAEHQSHAKDRLITNLRQRLDELADQPGPQHPDPTLADNIRLAHRAEQAEHLLQIERDETQAVRLRLDQFAARYPDLFTAEVDR